MTPKTRTVLFITANEAFNAGERDSMKSLASEIKGHERNEIQYAIYKVPTTLSPVPGNPFHLPVDNATYANVPTVSEQTIDLIKQAKRLDIIGVCNSAFKTIIDLHNIASKLGKDVHTHYITHIVNGIDDIALLQARQINIFSPITRDDLALLDEKLAQTIQLQTIETVPHTNTYLSRRDYEGFMATANGKEFQKALDKDQKFIFAVLNGGMGIGETDIHHPYTEREATAHGRALGQYAPADTALIVAHGGARNLTDENDFAQMTLDKFAAGYQQAQKEKGAAPGVFLERFAPDLSYNVIKAGYVLAQHDNCIAFISNAEGYGTMIGALLHVDNRKKLLGMFPFEACLMDNSELREKHVEKYHHAGIAKLYATLEGLKIVHHPRERPTPSQSRDPARQIIESLGLAAKDKG